MTTTYNTPGHVCPETGRLAMTVAEAWAREDCANRTFWLYNPKAVEIGLDPWRMLAGIDASVTLGDDHKPLHYEVYYTRAGSTLVEPRAIVYMQQTRAERAEVVTQSPTADDALRMALAGSLRPDDAPKFPESPSERVQRLERALASIQRAGNDSNPAAIWMQKVAAHALHPDRWPSPGDQP